MPYQQQLSDIGADAEQVEITYRTATQAGQSTEFAEAIDTKYEKDPDNLLYAAWHYRLQYAARTTAGRVIAWAWVIPLALLNGLVLWWLSDIEKFMISSVAPLSLVAMDLIPTIVLMWAPISAVSVLLYLALAGDRRWGRLLAATFGILGLAIYALLTYPQLGIYAFQEQYVSLMTIHLPLAAWAAVGVYLLFGHADGENRFAFLIKSLEVGIMAGLFAIAGMLFTGITFGLFEALGMSPSELIVRLFIAGGGGMIPILAIALIYDPLVSPAKQSFQDGLSKLIAMLMRILLPLTLLVLIVYLGFIPFNFTEPYQNRDVLIIYNGMLFAVMALLVGATPIRRADLSPRLDRWLRRGLIAVAALALIVGIYALSAIGYRTWQGQFTPNRLTFMGWNVINIGILLLLLVKQLRSEQADWLARMHSAFAAGALAYVGWTLVVILATPWLFDVTQQNLESAPVEIQWAAYESAGPVLLKCTGSPHIYLLEHGEKHWIKDIPTFEAERFEWTDVNFVTCPSLRALPDGPPIPRDAGPPPQP